MFLAAFRLSQAPTLEFVAVQRGDVAVAVSGYGALVSLTQRAVTADEGGVIEELHAQLGDRVEPGDPLLGLANPALRVERERQATEVRRSELEMAEKLSQLDLDLELARQRSRQSAVKVKVARAERDANLRLHEQGIVSALDLTRSEANLEDAQMQAQAEQGLSTMLAAQLQSRREAARLTAELAKDRLAELDRRIDGLVVRAKIGGVIKRVDAAVGTRVEPGAVLALIGPERPDAARVRFAQREASHLTTGLPVRLRSSTIEFEARVTRVAPDVVDGEIVVELKLLPSEADLRVDMPVQARLELAPIEDVLYLPSDYTPRADGRLPVWRERAGRHERVLLRQVRSVGRHLVFDSDIKEGDRIAIDTDALLEPTP